jgi:hypothetical protein
MLKLNQHNPNHNPACHQNRTTGNLNLVARPTKTPTETELKSHKKTLFKPKNGFRRFNPNQSQQRLRQLLKQPSKLRQGGEQTPKTEKLQPNENTQSRRNTQ